MSTQCMNVRVFRFLHFSGRVESIYNICKTDSSRHSHSPGLLPTAILFYENLLLFFKKVTWYKILNRPTHFWKKRRNCNWYYSSIWITRDKNWKRVCYSNDTSCDCFKLRLDAYVFSFVEISFVQQNSHWKSEWADYLHGYSFIPYWLT